MIKKLLPHVCIIISLIMLTFLVLDQYNPGMAFLGNDTFKILLLAYGIVTIVSSVVTVIRNSKVS